MSVERITPGASLIEILERVLDKGIVLDASARVSQAGIDPITDDAPIVVVPIQTYLK
jgi:gas vesicle structural protein